MTRTEPTIAQVLQTLAASYDSTVPEREVYDRVLEVRPSTAKNPHASIRNVMRFEGPRLGWIRLRNAELVPLRVVQDGLRFRIRPTADELEYGVISRSSLDPFVPDRKLDPDSVRFIDAKGRQVHASMVEFPYVEHALVGPHFSLDDWFARNHFERGDTIMITLRYATPLELHLEYEAEADFQHEAVAEQDKALLEDIATMIKGNSHEILHANSVVLPIYASASWRTQYPGRPWRELVESDIRLQIIEPSMIASSYNRGPMSRMFSEEYDSKQAAADQALLERIHKLQVEMHQSRQHDVAQGVWDGMAPRISTARTIIDMSNGATSTLYGGEVNTLLDHTATIEAKINRGDYKDEGWNEEFDDDIFLMDDSDPSADDFADIDDIDDINTFLSENPSFSEATRQLMESLSPQEIAQLEEASSLEDVQQILANHMTEMFRAHPSLFVPLEPPLLGEYPENGLLSGHIHDNGKRPSSNTAPSEEPLWDSDPLSEKQWEDEDDDSEEDEAADALMAETETALERSNELMEAFYNYLISTGKNAATAASRSGDLWAYADFLANYYLRSLAEGDYATLDENLFYYYPRKVINSSAQSARSMCTSIKQFYAFLKATDQISDDAFAVAIWKRREQAAKVIDLYDQIDGESPAFDRLFAHLFSPYTA